MNKTNLLIWTVVLLVILNLTTIGTILYHNYKENIDGKTIVLNTEGNNMLNGRFFRQNLGFNEDQMDAFRKANREFRPKANAIILQIDSLKSDMFTELKKTHSDTIRLNNLSRKTGDLHAELKIETNRFYLKMKSVCTPGQLKKLQITFTPLFRNAPCDGKGKGGQGRGRGIGKGFRNQQIYN